MALTPAEKQKRYRDRKQSVTKAENGNARYQEYDLPELPDDLVLDCNAGITWGDVLALPRRVVDEVYATCQGDILLRLKRAAGYYLRVVLPRVDGGRGVL